MFIIFTGIEGSGKTTLGNMLSKLINVPYLKQTRPRAEDNSDSKIWGQVSATQTSTTVELIHTLKTSIIMDRFHIDELVYSALYQRRIREELYFGIDLVLKMMGSVLVYMNADYETIAARRKMYKGEYTQRVSLFENYLQQTQLPIIRINGAEGAEANVRLVLSGLQDLGKIQRDGNEFKILSEKETY